MKNQTNLNGNIVQSEKQVKLPFYTQTWFIILMMFCCCFPIGIFLMWKYKKFNKPIRIIISGFFALMFISVLAANSNPSSTTSVANSAEATIEHGTTAPEITTVAPVTTAEPETTAIPETTTEPETTIPETTTEPETTTIPETTTEPETTVAAETTDSASYEAEFKAACQEIGYKTLLRNPDDYIGAKIVIVAKVQQIIQGGWFDDSQYYRMQTDTSGYDLYLDDEYFMYDTRQTDATKILQGDVLRVYAEFTGTETVTRALTGTKEEIPAINAFYIDIISE